MINVINEALTEIIDKIVEEKLKEAIIDLAAIKPLSKEFYSIKEASHILSLSESGLKSRSKTGKIKLIYDQNNITIHHKELERYSNVLLKQMKRGAN